MGCFCRRSVEALSASFSGQPVPVPVPGGIVVAEGAAAAAAIPSLPAVDEAIPAVASWLATLLLPAPQWQPDPAWQDVVLPEPPMPPQALGVLLGLVQAFKAGQAELGLDLTVPGHAAQLARIVATLNRRTAELERLLQDPAPWEQVAALNAQIDTVADALGKGHVPATNFTTPPAGSTAGFSAKPTPGLPASAGLPGVPPPPSTAAVPRAGMAGFEAVPPVEQYGPPLAPWLPLIRQTRALAPLIAVGRLLDLDFGAPASVDRLAALVRALRAIALPPLENPALVLRAVARMDAVARLRVSFGGDPRSAPFARVVAAVERKAAALRGALPDAIRVVDGQLLGMPQRPPNPATLLNAATIAAARRIVPDQLRWQPPPFEQLPLLTAGVPAMALSRAVATFDAAPIRLAPCGAGCDASQRPAVLA